MRESVKFTRPAEQWNNGLYCQWFELDGLEYSLKQHPMKHSQDEEYTHLDCEKPRDTNDFTDPRWVKIRRSRFQYGQRFECLLTPEAAITIIENCEKAYHDGHISGGGQARREIRDALGIRK